MSSNEITISTHYDVNVIIISRGYLSRYFRPLYVTDYGSLIQYLTPKYANREVLECIGNFKNISNPCIRLNPKSDIMIDYVEVPDSDIEDLSEMYYRIPGNNNHILFNKPHIPCGSWIIGLSTPVCIEGHVWNIPGLALASEFEGLEILSSRYDRCNRENLYYDLRRKEYYRRQIKSDLCI